ncbi:winged helix-turn-helix domain-containing protein [Colwellia sp. 1_MG-2023]|uniref:winged helix-turn-helix domain-containing protein n=1 Tax=Colwellia sp. 1_MG-2023 TaxID=3062649 RepID=UPI0026E462DA|nr:winged helix-turn-helix domain-containing protein [Colwellia sp. 1_MG-2023]MDO6446461.1 winged helix-turn-helix domain-containing protein [Colwellia sp. 1_MG-2023]
MHFAFGNIVVDSEQIIVTKHGEAIECEPRVFELLIFFCQHPLDAIPRDVLVNEVWHGRIVSDAAVNRAVGELRKLIEDEPAKPQWIKTVSKVGYRFTVKPSLIATSDNGSNNEYPDLKIKQWVQLPSIKSYWLLSFILILAIIFYFAFNGVKTVSHVKIIERQPVTSTMGSAFNPFYASATKTLYYLHRSEQLTNAQVYFQQANMTAQRLTQDNFYYTDVIVANDGSIYATRLNNLEERSCEIVVFDENSQQFRQLIDCGKNVFTPIEHDDRKNRLIYRFRNSISEPYAVYSYQIDTGRKTQLTHPTQLGNNLGDYVFALSKDSLTLAVVEYDGEGTDKLKLLDLNSNKVRANDPFINNVYGLIWQDDNQFLVSNNTGLYRFDHENLALTSVEKSDRFSRLMQDEESGYIFSERGQSTVNIFNYSKNDVPPQALTQSSGISQRAKFGNQSNIFAFVSDRNGQLSIYIKQEEQEPYALEFDDTIEYVSAMSWSANDQQLIVSMNNGLYLYSVTEKTWQQLAVSFNKIHHVAFVNKTIMFSAEINNMWNIWQLSLVDFHTKQITSKGGYSVQGNDKFVYFTKFTQPGLFQINLETQQESRVIQSLPISGWRHWQLRDDKIYYLLNKEYRVFDVNLRVEETVHNFDKKVPFSCDMSFNHQEFACDKVEVNTSNIWQFQLSQ